APHGRHPDRPRAPRTPRPLRPGPGGPARGPPRLRPLRRRQRAGIARLAPPHPGAQPARPGPAAPGPGPRPQPPGVARGTDGTVRQRPGRGPGRPRAQPQFAGVATRTSGAAGRRPGATAAGLPRGDRPSEPAPPALRGDCPEHGPQSRHGAHALGPRPGETRSGDGSCPMSADDALLDTESTDDDELMRLLEACLAEIEAGRAIDLERLTAEHPTLAGRLPPSLAGLPAL